MKPEWILHGIVLAAVAIVGWGVHQNDLRQDTQDRIIERIREGLEAQGQILSGAVARQDVQYTAVERQLTQVNDQLSELLKRTR